MSTAAVCPTYVVLLRGCRCPSYQAAAPRGDARGARGTGADRSGPRAGGVTIVAAAVGGEEELLELNGKAGKIPVAVPPSRANRR